MYRTVAVIAWAIALANPSLPDATAARYAKVLQDAVATAKSKGENWDPFTFVALIHHESRWRAGAVSRDGHDMGLGQSRAMYLGGCLKMKSTFPGNVAAW